MDPLCSRAVQRATRLLAGSLIAQSAHERRLGRRMTRLMEDPAGKDFTLQLVDRVFRSDQLGAQARRFRRLLEEFGSPSFLGMTERLMLGVGALVSRVLPNFVMPAVAAKLRFDSARVILPGEPAPLAAYLRDRRAQGVRVNLNPLGEAVLGEGEAVERWMTILRHLQNPAIDYLSLKISSIFSQINLVDWDGTLKVLKERLGGLYRAALVDGKFINLDMEEYRDLGLTLAAFQQTLEEPEFLQARAGIVLQAYLPDSWLAQRELTAWARKRVEKGGQPIKLRLVKGANLAMEKVEAELHGWQPAPFDTKAQTDANYCRMLEFACRPENAEVVHVGVASHNLFDLALGLELRAANRVEEWVELEMLEGMASHQARVMQREAGALLLYAPIVRQSDFANAMAYLIRRLEENTAPENFLRQLFDLRLGSEQWREQQERFTRSWEQRHTVSSVPRRGKPLVQVGKGFQNEPDTDWSLLAARECLQKAMEGWHSEGWPNPGSLEEVLDSASKAQPEWGDRGFVERGEVLRRCGQELARGRFDSIAMLFHEAKKSAHEADGEISEAIDFANYYARFRPLSTVTARPLGLVAIAPPWNFPYAIACGGILAALMAGNAVIFKPAPEAVTIGWRLVQQLWAGGVPREILQFFPCADGEIGQALICDPRIEAVVLTGAFETARRFQAWRPDLRLYAETSGKNAMIITAQADRELAIKDLVQSAFSHSGQKCSAASLAILEAEVYDCPKFRRQLRDAVQSLRVGMKAGSMVVPLMGEPSVSLRRALNVLYPGEEWLLKPQHIEGTLWTPGLRMGIKPGSWFQRTECFGPVLGLVRAGSLEEAISIQNESVYGLTGGIHSLDESEIAHWREAVKVGNAYINRPITGAIVGRQPFGGWKRSSIGPGVKAGGPDYVGLFCQYTDREAVSLAQVAENYAQAWEGYFSREHDLAGLRAESNVLRYRPCRGVILRLEHAESHMIERAWMAARMCQVPLEISVDESEDDLLARLPELARGAEFIRTVSQPSVRLMDGAVAAGLNWIEGPVLADGRVELKRWLREQSVCQIRHRYGLISPQFNGGD